MARRKQEERGIRDRMNDAYESARDRVDEAREQADEYVREHPMQSIAIAAGVGAVVAIGVTALLMKPRRRSFFDKFSDWF